MITLRRWLDRSFPERPPVDLFPAIVDRLRGAVPRLAEKIADVDTSRLTQRIGDAWSVQEHAGHLYDLEALWEKRIDEFLAGAEELTAADMTNKRTYGAHHNEGAIDEILSRFRRTRYAMISKIENLTETQIGATALHPRLQQPMRLIDLCHFVAEHDDHHLAIIHGLLVDNR